MYLFIFESIGTSELILIGIIALIFLGPRKLPEMARKIGKIMADFRGTASEFKETWQREVNFEEEAKAFDLNGPDTEPIAGVDSIATAEPKDTPAAPAVTEMDPASFEHMLAADTATVKKAEPAEVNDKKNWL
jgi:sec-independent protein translocase protein TatB